MVEMITKSNVKCKYPIAEVNGLQLACNGNHPTHIHKEVIDRFGRYPHRNLALGRESTAEELQFIKDHPNPYAP